MLRAGASPPGGREPTAWRGPRALTQAAVDAILDTIKHCISQQNYYPSASGRACSARADGVSLAFRRRLAADALTSKMPLGGTP